MREGALIPLRAGSALQSEQGRPRIPSFRLTGRAMSVRIIGVKSVRDEPPVGAMSGVFRVGITPQDPGMSPGDPDPNTLRKTTLPSVARSGPRRPRGMIHP